MPNKDYETFEDDLDNENQSEEEEEISPLLDQLSSHKKKEEEKPKEEKTPEKKEGKPKSSPKDKPNPAKKDPSFQKNDPIEEKKPEKKPKDPDSLGSQMTIALFWFLALLSTIFFIANIWDNAGPLIEGFAALLYGLFGWGGLLIVPFFILLAIEWKNYMINQNKLYKISMALVGVLLVSSLFHLIMIMLGAIAAPTFPAVFNSTVYWYHGTPAGGGVLGGFLGGLFYILMHGWVSLFVLLVLLVADVMLYLRMTPKKLFDKISEIKEERAEKRAELERIAAEKAAEEKAKAEEERLKKEEEARIAAERDAEERRKGTGIEFDFLNDKPEEDKKDDISIPAETPTEKKDKEETPALPITVYRPEDEKPKEEKTNYDFSDIPDDNSALLDGADNTDFGFGNDDGDDIDLAALLEAGKKQAELDSAAALAGDDTHEEDEDEISDIDEPDTVILPSEEPDRPAYVYPPVTLLSPNANPKTEDDREELAKNARKLVEVLKSFRVETDIVNISRGPTITRYELAPKVGVRVRAIANLVDDIALNLETSGVRIEAPIPGKAAVGVEVPNKSAEIVYLRDLIESDTFRNAKSKLTACVGMDVSGAPIVMDIAKLPHMLIAGATGMGKSIAVNCIIMSLLYKATPDELKLILVDPKKVEFRPYDKLPHLLIPVVTSPKKAAGALATAVNEMERRFELIELAGVRDIKGYNKIAETDPTKEKLPSIVIIIDELADLMMTAKDDVEDSICRIAQKARAAGIHLIICTQRPSVDVITGLIKANVPSRIALTVASNIDSRTIIDVAGAEKLIGRGDMLFAPVGAMKPMRVQGAFVSDPEVEAVATFIRNQFKDVHYDDSFINQLEIEAEKCGQSKKKVAADEIDSDDELDPKFYEAVEVAVEMGKISTSLLQRKLSLGYGRAAKIIDKMEQMGIVGPQEGQKPRNTIFTRQDYQELVMNRGDN